MTGRPTKTWTILQVLDWTRAHFEQKGLAAPRLDAEVLIAHALGLARVMLYAKFDQPLLPHELESIRGLVARRARGEPVAYLTGRREFWSLDLAVTADTLIPRPDTETLVEVALEALPASGEPVVVDVGTGTGAIALALATERKAARVYATDVSEAALAVARGNAERLGLARVTFVQGDLLDALPPDAGPIDLLVSNLPYIPSADIAHLMPDVRLFEPRLALDGGPDGLDLVRRLLRQLAGRLAPGARVVLEAGHDQLDAVAALLREAGAAEATITRDPGGHPRVAAGVWR
jgi:release factor glutamine methyltransferase